MNKNNFLKPSSRWSSAAPLTHTSVISAHGCRDTKMARKHLYFHPINMTMDSVSSSLTLATGQSHPWRHVQKRMSQPHSSQLH